MTSKLESAKIKWRNTIYLSPRFRKGDEGDYLDGVEDDFEEGALWLLKELEDFPILAAGSYEWQNGFVAGCRTILTEARKLCGKKEHE